MTASVDTVRSFDAVGPAAIAAFGEDGVICLRQGFDALWINQARAGIARNIANPGRFFRDHTSASAPGRYLFEFWSWPRIPEFREITFNSPAGAIAGRLMESTSATMVMDNWFLRETGASDSAPWHHDEPYFDFTGRLCILWLPLEPVARDEGLVFVRGSHRLGRLFAAAQFSENLAFDCIGDDYAPMPDFAAEPSNYHLMYCDTQVGDCLVFDFRTVHAAARRDLRLPHASHRFTLRFAADGVIFRPRGKWTWEISDYLIAQGQRPNAPLDCPLMPLVWRAHENL